MLAIAEEEKIKPLVRKNIRARLLKDTQLIGEQGFKTRVTLKHIMLAILQ